MCNSCVYQIALARMRYIMIQLHVRAVKTNTGMRVSGDDGMWGVTSRWSWLVWACSHGNRLVSWLLPCIWNTIIKIDIRPERPTIKDGHRGRSFGSVSKWWPMHVSSVSDYVTLGTGTMLSVRSRGRVKRATRQRDKRNVLAGTHLE